MSQSMGAGNGVISPGTRIVEEVTAGDGKSFPKTGDKVIPASMSRIRQLETECFIFPQQTAEKNERSRFSASLQVVVHYTGCLAETGRCFDSSRARGHAFTFAIGCGRVIKGWDVLLLSVSKGARVNMHIAAIDGYGAEGQPPNVPRNADLVFDVELLNINEPLVQEGIRFKQELEEIARQKVEAEQLEQVQRQRGAADRGGRDAAGSDSESSDSSSSSESSGAARKRRRREKERRREKKERHREKKERKRQKREGDKGDKAAREREGGRERADKKERKRSRKG